MRAFSAAVKRISAPLAIARAPARCARRRGGPPTLDFCCIIDSNWAIFGPEFTSMAELDPPDAASAEAGAKKRRRRRSSSPKRAIALFTYASSVAIFRWLLGCFRRRLGSYPAGGSGRKGAGGGSGSRVLRRAPRGAAGRDRREQRARCVRVRARTCVRVCACCTRAVPRTTAAHDRCTLADRGAGAPSPTRRAVAVVTPGTGLHAGHRRRRRDRHGA